MKLRSGRIILKESISKMEAVRILISLKQNHPIKLDKKKQKRIIKKSLLNEVNIKLI